MSAEGACSQCDELHWWYILVTFFTGAINMFLFYSGAKKEKEVPHPFMTYLNKTLMFFFQCLPFLTFRNPNQTLRPITELLGNLSPDSTEEGMCMFYGLGARDKLWLNLAAPSILAFVMSLFWVAIQINMRRKKFPDAEDPVLALAEWLELEKIALKAGVWSMCLVIYGTNYKNCSFSLETNSTFHGSDAQRVRVGVGLTVELIFNFKKHVIAS